MTYWPVKPSEEKTAMAAIEEAYLRGLIEVQLAAGEPHLHRQTLQRLERVLLMCVLEHTKGSQRQAAKVLGITRGSLRNKLRQLGITIVTTVNNTAHSAP
jgi:two-component system nitrogen regulation response regulator GlnG